MLGSSLTGWVLDPLDSLHVRYTFNDSGNPAYDESGNGLHGALNGATWVNDGARVHH